MRVSRVIGAVIGVFMLAAAVPAAAQSVPAGSAPASKIEIGVLGGLSSVQNVGGLAGGQIAFRATPIVHLVAEGMWMQDAVTRAQLSAATGFGAYFSALRGKTAVVTLNAPATYGGAGLRVLIPTQSSVHPYAAVGAGMAKVAKQAKITLDGTDITSQLASYGVTLGSDLNGDVTKLAITGGLGVLIDRAKLSFDLGVHLTSIQTDGQKTNALRGQIGISYKF